jgi:prostaglandin-endoperoxide synthase 2
MVLPVTSGFWRKNGFKNGLRIVATTHCGPMWWLLRRTPRVRSVVNRTLINRLIYTMPTRPLGLSTLADYRSWPGLTDRRWSARHLSEDPDLQEPPPVVGDVVELFRRPEAGGEVSPKSTLLFPHFAQWFVDGFLRTDPRNVRKNKSTHDIDLSQLYGQTHTTTKILRHGAVGKGQLASQFINGQEFPPHYFGKDGKVRSEYENLEIVFPGSDKIANLPFEDPKTGIPLVEFDPSQKEKLFALGIARGNIHYGLVMMSTLFLREHNRVARLIAAENPGWDDDQVFETTRNTLIVVLLTVVIEDYINHITPIKFKLFAESGIGVKEKWYRQNWMSVEFNLLYRWHTMIPSRMRVGGKDRDVKDVLWDNDLVTSNGLAALFDEASKQPCNAIGLLNTDPSMLEIEGKSIGVGRTTRLASYNDYRVRCGYPKFTSFEDLSSNPAVREALRKCYGQIDKVELYPGLFAEDIRKGGLLPTLMATMVAVDAFSQSLTNPLLAPGIFDEETFSKAGMGVIRSTSSLEQIVKRNIPGEAPNPRVDFNQERRSFLRRR